MSKPEKAQISVRKVPQQARSADLVATILEASIQVLAEEGAQRFTTARVAERAGVSIGSLYQYFPNKAAILFRLQSDEWRQTNGLLLDILKDTSQPPLARLRLLVHAFVRSECDEADMRVALSDAAPLYRDAPEAHAARARGRHAIMEFLMETLPDCPDDTRELASDLISTTLSSVGKSFSETPRRPDEITAYAEALADMLCGYVASLAIRVEWQ